MERSSAAEDREHDDGRNLFERFVEATQASGQSGPVLLRLRRHHRGPGVSLPLFGDLKAWMAVLHTVSSVLSLLLLVLLENSGRRAEEAAQEKLNVLAEALSDLMASRAQDDPGLGDAVKRLRDAVGLEARH
jgi:hypothetical protein